MWREWTREDASVSQRSMPPLHPAMKPADELSGGERLGRSRDDLCLRQVLIGQLAVVERCLDRLRIECRPEEWIRTLRVKRLALRHRQGCTHRYARITWIGGNKDVIEQP